MSDERLRELERVWRESGDPTDEAQLLLARVRAGILAQSRLELAAFLGHPAARCALGEDAPRTLADAWFEDDPLDPWDKEAGVRMAIAAARLVLPDYEAAREGERRPRAALEAAQAWVLAPSAQTEAAALAAAEATERCFRGSPAGPDPLNRAYEASTYAAQAASEPWRSDLPEPTRPLPGEGQHSACWALQFAAQWTGDEAVQAAVRDEVVPWALGNGDPVRERVVIRGELEIPRADLA